MNRSGTLFLCLFLGVLPGFAGALSGTLPKLHIGGFTDFNFFANDKSGDAPSSGFKEGQFILHISSRLSPRISFFSELSITAKRDQFKTEVERTIIKFDLNDAFKISFGRYHTPINWWNTAFHHGQWLQTTAERPQMTRFGGDFIPVHFVGMLLDGTLPAGGMNFRYQAGVGNGRDEIISRGGDAGDVNNSRAALLNLSIRPDRAYSLIAGTALYRDLIDLADGPRFTETTTAAYIVWNREDPEVIGEYARVTHENRDSGETFDAYAFYVQFAWRLALDEARWKPYLRYEVMRVDEADPVYGGLLDQNLGIAGIRYDVASFAAIKLEYHRTEDGTDPAYNSGHAQISIAF